MMRTLLAVLAGVMLALPNQVVAVSVYELERSLCPEEVYEDYYARRKCKRVVREQHEAMERQQQALEKQ